MADPTGIKFWDDPSARNGPHTIPLDFKTGLAAIPGYPAPGFPIAQLHKLKDNIRKIANQVVSDGQIEPTEIVLNPDGSVLIYVSSTILSGQIDQLIFPAQGTPGGAPVSYAKAAALDFADGIDAYVPIPPSSP